MVYFSTWFLLLLFLVVDKGLMIAASSCNEIHSPTELPRRGAAGGTLSIDHRILDLIHIHIMHAPRARTIQDIEDTASAAAHWTWSTMTPVLVSATILASLGERLHWLSS